MINILSFVSFTNNQNHSPGSTAAFGELSNEARTSATEILQYSGSEVSLSVFSSKNSEGEIEPPDELIDAAKVAAGYIYDLFNRNGFPENKTVLEQALSQDLPISGLTDVTVGAIVTGDSKTCPDKVTLTVNGNSITLWFSNDHFLNDYPEYTIEVYAPVSGIDKLLQNEIDSELYRPDVILQNMTQRSHNGTPMRTTLYQVEWFNPNDVNDTRTIYFGLNLYGRAALDTDKQRLAIAKFILERSSQTEASWANVLTSIFRANEFYIIPLWDNISIGDKEVAGGIYSPFIRVKDAFIEANNYAVGYPELHVNDNLEVFSVNYKSLSVASIGSPSNVSATFRLQEIFSKYALIKPTEKDHYRMGEDIDFYNVLYRLIVLAENHGPTSDTPPNFSVISRGGHKYISTSIRDVNLLVITKLSYFTDKDLDYDVGNAYQFLGEHEC